MRTTGLKRSLAALAAFAVVSGCTAHAVDADGKKPPVRIAGSAAPASGAKGKDDGRPASPSKGKDGTSGSAGEGKDEDRPTAEPAKVLWSRGDQGDDVRRAQARLHQVAWLITPPTGTYDARTVAAVKGFQGKRGLPRTGDLDAVTWQRLRRMTHEPAAWELYPYGGQPAAKPDPRCMKGRVLCVSKTSRTLRWMIDGRTVSEMDVRFGSQYTPTREGVFSVSFKSRHHVSTIYHTSMPYAMFFSGGQAVHYSSDFAARGYYGASHGCVNVRDEGKVAALFAQVRTGDKVVVYW
ncbi:L,D-transpeptidase family protein [Streptomyces sp. NBC_00151]|uniref:L,D-transpeptidase family protein n=1 Tax=Streptomyces sp. NBC_00151 TaxID=2975669 RepID=UPI002DDBF7C7|nr:L,D-transpeptidase family protein [Streptomyces sp. NBC_00151]WRZ39835.1 L,D-transpeptidase family protein [Streptomyces sp. NBC_00151]